MTEKKKSLWSKVKIPVIATVAGGFALNAMSSLWNTASAIADGDAVSVKILRIKKPRINGGRIEVGVDAIVNNKIDHQIKIDDLMVSLKTLNNKDRTWTTVADTNPAKSKDLVLQSMTPTQVKDITVSASILDLVMKTGSSILNTVFGGEDSLVRKYREEGTLGLEAKISVSMMVEGYRTGDEMPFNI